MQVVYMDLSSKLAQVISRLPSYFLSHIYDIVAYEAGILAAVIISFIKDPIKKGFKKAVYKKHGEAEASTMAYRRLNLLIALMAAILSEVFFQIFAYFSKTIKPISGWTLIVALVPIGVYTLIEQLFSGWLGALFVVVSIPLIYFGNKLYCDLNENHHKLCYAIKFMFAIYAVMGIIGQFFYHKKPGKNVNKNAKEHKE